MESYGEKEEKKFEAAIEGAYNHGWNDAIMRVVSCMEHLPVTVEGIKSLLQKEE